MFIKKLTLQGFTKKCNFQGGRGARKKQDISGLPKWVELKQFADLRGSWQKRVGGVFVGGLILQCTLCVISMVDMSHSWRLVTLFHMFFSQYNTLLLMKTSSEESTPLPPFPHPKKCIHNFLLVCNLLETCSSVVLCYQFIQCTYRPTKLKT